ncbi:MAG: alpha/beta fold hydrolase [Rhodospirillaceae bacterium]|nr:alpha/beta fold hydrolase [Rhodospirillaceae bacterium]
MEASTAFRFFRFFLISVALTSCGSLYEPLGPPITDPHIDGNNFVTRDGVRLPVSVWGPRERPKVVVVALHSFGEFRDAYALIGEYLAKRDIAVWAYDQRGFGDAPHRGVWSGNKTMTQDFQDFVSAVQSITGTEIPVVFLGESMGAAVVLGALAEPNTIKPHAVILSGPGVREDRPWRYWFNAGLWLATRVAPGFEVKVERVYDSRLDDIHASRWAKDSRVINRVRLDTYYGLIRLSDFGSKAAQSVEAETLVLFGTKDDQIHPKSICALMTRLGDNGLLQVFEDKPHLMFQVRDQMPTLSLIEQWIDTPGHVSRPSQGLPCEL